MPPSFLPCMDVGRALFYSSSYCGNVGNNDMIGKRMWNSVTAAQCSYVRFFRIFREVEYGPKYAIFFGLGLRRRSSVCRRPRPAAIPSPRTRARGRTVAGSSDVGLAQHTRGTGPGALRSSRKHVAARAFGGGERRAIFRCCKPQAAEGGLIYLFKKKRPHCTARDERTINRSILDRIRSTRSPRRRPRQP